MHGLDDDGGLLGRRPPSLASVDCYVPTDTPIFDAVIVPQRSWKELIAGDKNGSIVIPSGTNVWPHELATAKALAMASHDIEFLPRIDGKEVKSADVLMDGVVWEMKSPTSTSAKSLQKVLRRAGRQSHNVIVDTARMKGVSDKVVQRELTRPLPLVASVQRLRLVTKARDVFDIA